MIGEGTESPNMLVAARQEWPVSQGIANPWKATIRQPQLAFVRVNTK